MKLVLLIPTLLATFAGIGATVTVTFISPIAGLVVGAICLYCVASIWLDLIHIIRG